MYKLFLESCTFNDLKNFKNYLFNIKFTPFALNYMSLKYIYSCILFGVFSFFLLREDLFGVIIMHIVQYRQSENIIGDRKHLDTYLFIFSFLIYPMISIIRRITLSLCLETCLKLQPVPKKRCSYSCFDVTKWLWFDPIQPEPTNKLNWLQFHSDQSTPVVYKQINHFGDYYYYYYGANKKSTK